jgi:penicillin-binding protein 2
VNAAIALQVGAIWPMSVPPVRPVAINCVHSTTPANLTVVPQYSCKPVFLLRVMRNLIEHVPDSLVADTAAARRQPGYLAALRPLIGLDTLLRDTFANRPASCPPGVLRQGLAHL